MTGRNRFVGASYGTQQQVNRHVEAAIVAYKREETIRLAPEMPPQEITATQDDTCTGGLCLVASEPMSNSRLREHTAEARDQDTWNALLEDALALLKCTVIQSTSDEAPGLLAYVQHHLGAHHSPDLFHVQPALSKAVAAPIAATQRAAHKAVAQAEETLTRVQEPFDSTTSEPAKRGPGRPPKVAVSLEQLVQAVEAARGVPKRQATIECVSGYVRPQGRQLDLAPPASYAMHAHLIPSLSLDRVASTRTVTAGKALHELAERLRTPLFEPTGAFGPWNPVEPNTLKREAAKLAEVFQRSSSKVAGRHGYRSLRNHQLRGLDHPRKRACLTAVHTFFLTRADGPAAAERFFGQQPRSMFAAILASVEIPPAPLRPPRRAVE